MLTFFISLIIPLSFQVHSNNKSDSEKKIAIQKLYMNIKKSFPEVEEISLKDFKTNPSDFILVDARTDEEIKISTLPRAIKKTQLSEAIAKNPNKRIVVYCTIGYRSAKFIKHLNTKDTKAYNLEGSLLGWLASGGEIVDSSKALTKKVHVYGKKWDLVPDKYEVFKKTIFNWF